MRYPKLLITLIFIVAACSLNGRAAVLTDRMFKLDSRDGLLSNSVKSITQDKHGFIWVVTENGLNRFDGSRFFQYTKENSGLTSNDLNKVLADPENPNIIWIATQRDGLCLYDYSSGRISKFENELLSPDIPGLSAADDGGIWVTHYHFGVDHIDSKPHSVKHYSFRDYPGMPRRCWCAIESPDGKYLYVGHVSEGMTRIDLSSGKSENYRYDPLSSASLPDDEVLSIYADNDGFVWIGTRKGLAILDTVSNEIKRIGFVTGDRNSILPGSVMDIKKMANGEIWLSMSEGGISVFAPTETNNPHTLMRFHSITPENSNIAGNYIVTSQQDTYGNIWIGSFCNGLNILSYEKPFFENLVPADSEIQKYYPAWSVSTDKKGNVWIGSDDVISFIGMDGEKKEVRLPNLKNHSHTQIKALQFDKKGNLWIGTSNAGVLIYNPASDKLINGFNQQSDIRSFYLDEDGTMWIGTVRGLYKSDSPESTVRANDINSKLWDSVIKKIARDKAGYLWIGTLGKGAFVFDSSNNLVAHFMANEGLNSNAINDIYADNAGDVWVATRDGMAQISVSNYQVVRMISVDDGLKNANVKSIHEDRNGNLWLGTNKGIACFNRENNRVSVYEYSDDLHLEMFNDGASAEDGVGRLYFGTVNGAVRMSPQVLDSAKNDMEIQLTNFTVLGHKDTAMENEAFASLNEDCLELPYDMNTFKISFNILDYTRSKRTDLEYNLKGFDELWTETTDHSAIFRNIPPGEYEFQVRQRQNGGDWGMPQSLLKIKIAPPLYLTWWAKVIYCILVILIAGVVICFYRRKLRLEQNLIIEMENGKNRQNLNEERLRFFTNITHELRTPLTLILGPLEELAKDGDMPQKYSTKIQTIRSSSMRLLNLINGILEFRKTETQNRPLKVGYGNIYAFVGDIASRFKELNNNEDVSIVVDIPDEEVNMYFDKEIVTTILNNLAGNALKYTAKGIVAIKAGKVSENGVDYMDLSVSDTGCGIAPEAVPHIFERYYQAMDSQKVSGTGIGLALTKNLVDLHEAKITVSSIMGKGSKFTVRFMLDNFYPNAKHEENSIAEPTDTPTDTEGMKPVLLIVEDDAGIRKYVEQAFEPHYSVHTATNGEEGYEKARQLMPDIVVSDIMMPVMNGIELCKKLKTDIATSHIQVILLTAKDSLEDKEEGYRCGADSYLTKPFTASLLKARIDNMLEIRHRIAVRLMSSTTTKSTQATPESGDGDEAMQLSPLDQEFIDSLKQIIFDNLEMEELDIAFLADKLCMSHSTLYRKVKGITGVTIKDYITKTRMDRAAELLRENRMQISDIAFRVGYGSVQYFRKIFKREFGMTPSEFVSKK